MRDRAALRPPLSPAQRGRIVQRVIVDGWTSAEAAAAADVPERLVAAWVAAYRRDGMASLRHAPGKTVAAEIVRLRLGRPVGAVLRSIGQGLRWLLAPRPPTSPSPLRRSQDDRRGGP